MKTPQNEFYSDCRKFSFAQKLLERAPVNRARRLTVIVLVMLCMRLNVIFGSVPIHARYEIRMNE